MDSVHTLILQKVPNAMAKRDMVDLNVYGMEGVPPEVIEDRLRRKVKKKMIFLEKELKKVYKIDLDDPKFKIDDYEIPDPRPKRATPNLFRTSLPLMPTMRFMPPPMFPPMPGFMPPGVMMPPMAPLMVPPIPPT